MARRGAGAPALLAALLLAACASAPPPDAQLSGLALTRAPMLLPPDTVFEAALLVWPEDGAPPVALARQRSDDAGSPPYALRLPYHQSEIRAGARYTVQAGVLQGGRLLLYTRPEAVVLLDPGLRHVDLRLSPVSLLPANAQAEVALTQTWWELSEIVDAPDSDAPAAPDPADPAMAAHLLLDGASERLSGAGGCNRLTGSYRLQGAALRFAQLNSTLRLCLTTGLREALFFERLPLVASYRQRGRTLELRAADGRPLLRFTARQEGIAPLAPQTPPLSQ
ncbi:META domain-containing protein [Comamonas sp. NLF-1-9]|uniref:META domain-containing protein n=1 Tax=Comamonas sp. NLF-1-9 TaxID=2853163 RepID=UPI001C44B5C9|nr:META domain-containing protein [Comamonas sp. NLF-1-9]QXL84067.1 META domain-containing protein [Comamonas sp. NLF-1-9]